MNCLKKIVVLFMSVLMLASLVAVPKRAAADMTDDDNFTEYVLILSNTLAQHDGDTQNNRAAAAKLFVDMLPADNARLSIFVIANKDLGNGINWTKNKYDPVKSYSLILNKDHIDEPYSHNRMFCIYQIEKSVTNLSQKSRKDIKEKIDWFYNEVPITDAFNDLHCAVYAAMDYLAGNQIKNACMLMISDETTASYHGFKRGEGVPEGDLYWAISNKNEFGEGNPEGDSSFLHWVQSKNEQMSNHEIKYNWSFNWFDLTLPEKRPADRSGYTFLSDLSQRLNGEWHAVEKSEAYSDLPGWTVSMLKQFTGNIDPEPAVKDQGKYKFRLDTVFSEVNIAVTGSSLNDVTIEYFPEDNPAQKHSVTFRSTDNNTSQTILERDDVWFSCEKDKYINNRFTYSNIKLILPNPGEWWMSFGGAADDITVQIVKAQDAELKLSTKNAGTEQNGVFYQTFKNKQPVTFEASFWYNNRQITSKKYLTDNLPYTALYYRNTSGNKENTLQPMVGNGVLEYTFTPPEAGTFRFYTNIKASKYFSATRNGDYEYQFTFTNNVPRLKDPAKNTVEEVWTLDTDMPFGNYIEYFTDDDGEEAQLQLYQLTCESFENDKDEKPQPVGNNTFHIPNARGNYVFSVRAVDPEQGISNDKLTIKVRVNNEAPALIDPNNDGEEIYLVSGIPDFLIQAGIFTDDERVRTYFFDKIFTDSDGDELVYTVKEEDNRNDTGDAAIVTVTRLDDGVEIRPNGKNYGEQPMKVILYAQDHTESASPNYVVTVHVANLYMELLTRYWWVLAIIGVIIIIIIILRLSRRVHGRWEVTLVNPQNQETCYHSFSSLAATKNRRLRKTKVSVKDICNFALRKEEADEERLNTSDMSVRNPILYGTVLPGKCKMEFKPKNNMKVYINGEEKAKGGKIKLRPRQEVMLQYLDEYDSPSLTVTMSFN